jgi:hypothetical protein
MRRFDSCWWLCMRCIVQEMDTRQHKRTPSAHLAKSVCCEDASRMDSCSHSVETNFLLNSVRNCVRWTQSRTRALIWRTTAKLPGRWSAVCLPLSSFLSFLFLCRTASLSTYRLSSSPQVLLGSSLALVSLWVSYLFFNLGPLLVALSCSSASVDRPPSHTLH